MIKMLGEQLEDFQKKMLKHDILVLLGKEKTYSEQQKQFSLRIQEEITEMFKRKSGESNREWINRINRETDEYVNYLNEIIEKLKPISVVANIMKVILKEISAYYVIPFIVPMLFALNEVAEEECINRNYTKAISKFDVFCSKSDLTLYNLFCEANRLKSGEEGLGTRTWNIYYDIKKVMKEYCKNGVLEDIQSDELFPHSTLLGDILVVAGMALLCMLADTNTEISDNPDV